MRQQRAFGTIAACCIAALSTNPSFAHHGVNGQFDTSQEIEVSGVVTGIRLVNPHSYVYFDVTNDAGEVEEWRCELSSGSLLKRKGWSAEMFADGTEITINGGPARNEDYACYTETITFSDGRTIGRNDELDDDGAAVVPPRELTLDDGVTPNISGNWVAERMERPSRGGGDGPPPGAEGAGGRPPRAEGAGGPPPGAEGAGAPSLVELTEAGAAAVEGYEREDNPRFHCQATNIILDWWFDQMVNTIEQTEDTITLTYGFMDIVRTIHLDMDAHPDDITPSRAGHSIGKWEDGVLVVDTIGFDDGYIVAPPVPNGAAKNSPELHIVERFTVSEDGTTLTREYVADDPLYMVGTYSGEDTVNLTDASFEPYNCDDLTGDTY